MNGGREKVGFAEERHLAGVFPPPFPSSGDFMEHIIIGNTWFWNKRVRRSLWGSLSLVRAVQQAVRPLSPQA